MAKVPKGAENFNRLSKAHGRYIQTTDGAAIAYSEREIKFTFAKKHALPRPVHMELSSTSYKIHAFYFIFQK